LDIKIQYNAGQGGCFPMHFDTTPQVSNRQITGTLYLNPDWKPSDGGQLRVYPFPYDKVNIIYYIRSLNNAHITILKITDGHRAP
jgi:Rps23 Pro-64 3,4-dihydroxylase Tpa1-like proline 4-hydroxylase